MQGKNIILSGIAILVSLASSVAAEGVQALTPDTFDSVIGLKPALVEFYAPWCGHCQNLESVYNELGEAFAEKDDKVLIAKANADAHKELGRRFGVRGYPTIKWFPSGINSQPEEYFGERDLESLTSFVTSKSGVKATVKSLSVGKTPSVVEILTDENFEQIIGKTGKTYLVEFYAPWCHYCQALAPTYEKVARDFFNEKNVVIAKIDATKETKSSDKYEVDGYPTIKLFDAEGNVHDYEGGRNENDFVLFINKRAGTKRIAGGRLSLDAGRIKQLDDIAERFLQADSPEEKKELSKEGIKLAESLKSSDENAQQYERLFEKVLESPEFVQTESARLKQLIKSSTASETNIDDLSIHQNILSAFSSGDAGENAPAAPKEEL
ncbi:thioredoxin-like protein [Dissophora ornata]|nr:thioredoxin-like protein [Dissophora ornata]